MSQTEKFIVSCSHCGLNGICIPRSLTSEEIDLVDAEIRRAKPLHKNSLVFETGDPFTSIYAVRSGALKAYNIDENGEEYVVGFFLPGELIGLVSIDSGVHLNTAKTLETSTLCEIPFDQVETLSKRIHNLQSHMYRILSREIGEDQKLQLLLGKKTAEEKIGTFILNLSHRYKQRHLSSTLFRLPMARTDIANYLGLAVETVSRIITRLQVQKILKVDGKDVEILNHQQLCLVAHSQCIADA